MNSDYFTLPRGTRQGCPLSPLLFALAIEPLSISLRTSSLFQGVTRGSIEHRVTLYADGLLLYMSNPVAHIPSILEILWNFGSFSGTRLIYKKVHVFP